MGILDKKILLFDIETDGLLDNLTKIHCLAYTELKIEKGEIIESEIKSTSDVKKIQSIVNRAEAMLGHNIIQYDIPALKKLGLLNKKISAIDTLGLSWYTQNTREKHGLEQYGDEFKIPKPKIADWKNLTTEEYLNRCEMDVRINLQLFKNQFELLKKIYGKKEGVEKLINYISFKLDCIREQEENPLRIDLEKARENMDKLAKMRDEKFEVLKQHMTNVIHYKKISKPSKPYKKDGSLSAAGIKWFKLLKENNLPEDYEDEVEVIHKTEEPNPQSVTQLKDWLYFLGWKPDKFTERPNTKGEINKVPQIYDGEVICNSIRNMFEEYPYLENLDMIGKIKHRYGIFKSFLSMNKEYVPSLIAGFTNTFRVKHVKPFANMPKVGTFFGAEIRGCIVTPENKLCCGSDCSALEDTTKQHYMYFFDPEYVKELRTEGFDPHLDVAVLSKLLTLEQAEEHKKGIKKYTAERNKAKTVNFSGVYGAGPATIAKNTGMSLKEARDLHKIYWERNKAVKLVSENLRVKIIFKNGEIENFKISDLMNIPREYQKDFNNDVESMWLFNPVSKLYLPFRKIKDAFSTCNQSTGVFLFDNWIREVRKRGVKISLQYHDEIMFYLNPEDKDKITKILLESMEVINKNIKLNVPLGCSIDFGKDYAEVH